MNEWGFASEITKWWAAEFPHHPEWLLHSARVEEVVPGSQQRSDILVSGQGPILSGELRLPDHPQSAPYNLDNLKDAVGKALARGCPWAFTSDATVILLIDVQRPGPLITKIVHQIDLVPFSKRSELNSAAFLAKVRERWIEALHELAPIISGTSRAPGMSPDELFVNALRELLSAPVGCIRDALNAKQASDVSFRTSLIEWMVDEQGWLHDPSKWEEEVLLTARLTVYVFATRLLFYEALRRSQPNLRSIDISAGSSARVIAAALHEQFDEARELSGDYENLFGWDRIADYALVTDGVVPLWRRVVEHIGVFDVSHVGHDILGRLFERLIDPHERYEWGQHYTLSDVVDLMLSFAIPDSAGSILDPACGGGTFLVRAYARKKAADPHRSHQELLAELFGADVSGFAATIATVNLAVRQLDFSDNYPRIATRSFFRIQPGENVLSIPTVSLGKKQAQPVAFSSVKAVVGNPPYVRLHKLGNARQSEAQQVLGQSTPGRVRTPRSVNKTANYHIYFWLHGAQFLQPGGRIAFLTAGEWLDADYGAALQLWLLENFCIEAFIESGKEAWFSEARVGTVVTIARRCDDPVERASNNVRFIFLRKRLRDLFGPTSDDPLHFTAVDSLRNRLLALGGEGESDDFDWSVIKQSELLTLGQAATAEPSEDEASGEQAA